MQMDGFIVNPGSVLDIQGSATINGIVTLIPSKESKDEGAGHAIGDTSLSGSGTIEAAEGTANPAWIDMPVAYKYSEVPLLLIHLYSLWEA
jgi:hypothetical protein